MACCRKWRVSDRERTGSVNRRAVIGPLLCLALLAVSARPPQERLIAVLDAGKAPADSSAVKARPAPMKKIEEFRRDPAFRYDRKEEPLLSLWDYIIAWLREKLRPFHRDVDGETVWRVLEYTVYLVVAAAVLLVIVKLIGADPRGLFFSPKKKRAAPDDGTDIEQVDFDRLIAASLERRDYRAVVRLLYRKALKELSARGLIRWRIDKTNRDYLAELSQSPLRVEFTELTRIFECIWYGSFDLPADTFAAVRERYEGFYRALSEGNR